MSGLAEGADSKEPFEVSDGASGLSGLVEIRACQYGKT